MDSRSQLMDDMYEMDEMDEINRITFTYGYVTVKKNQISHDCWWYSICQSYFVSRVNHSQSLSNSNLITIKRNLCHKPLPWSNKNMLNTVSSSCQALTLTYNICFYHWEEKICKIPRTILGSNVPLHSHYIPIPLYPYCMAILRGIPWLYIIHLQKSSSFYIFPLNTQLKHVKAAMVCRKIPSPNTKHHQQIMVV